MEILPTLCHYEKINRNGVLRLHTPSGMMDYMAGRYSIFEIDAPLWGTVPAFPSRQDFLAVSVKFLPSKAIQTVLSVARQNF